MLNIRNKQLNEFEARALERYIRDLTEYVRREEGEEEVFPSGGSNWVQVKDLPEEALLRMVKAGVVRARNYGLMLDCDITAFVSLMFAIAPNFDTQANIQTLLSDPEFSPEERMELLVDLATEEDWEQAEQSYDESAWEPRL